MHQTWSERERERERERGNGSRAVEGWDGWGQWQLSTAETRTDWRSDHPVVLDVPSAAIFYLRRARAAQYLTCDFVDGGAAGWLLSTRTSFSTLSLDSSAGEKVYFYIFIHNI